MSVGLSIQQYQKDFGIGLQLTSPYWGKKTNSAIRLAYNFQYLEHLDENSKIIWTNYQNLKLGYVLATKPIQDFFRYYGEIGGIFIFPNEIFSGESVVPGIYGIFGFEFLFPNENKLSKSIFIELGALGTGAKAEKVETEPIYSNGFLISTGLRLFFRKR